MTEPVCYLDHASTAFPRAPGVAAAMVSAVTEMASPHRGGHSLADEASRLLEQCRQSAARRFGLQDPQRVIFTSGCTDSINQVLHGMLRPGNRVVACAADHNAVIRPLHALARLGVEVCLLPPTADGLLAPARLRDTLKGKRCHLLVLTHASNVTGAILNLEDCLGAARKAGTPILLDAAQSAGHLPLALDEFGIGAAAIPGHKALAGPPGIGLLCLGRGFELPPFRQGGTGFDSAAPDMPERGPARHEAGTPNLPGIGGLLAALDYVPADAAQAARLRQEAYRALTRVPGVTVYAAGTAGGPAAPVLSFTVAGLPPEVAALWLAERGIAVRAGLHCAPGAHRALGTFERGGTVRVSFGVTNTDADLERLIAEVSVLAGGSAVRRKRVGT